jgi:uncharacterized protein (TIGR03083 family)
MDPRAHLDALDHGVAQLRGVLATGDLDAPVSGCPGWTLADLGAHVGGIYRFAVTGLVEQRGLESKEPGPTERDAMLAWFDDAAASLLETLHRIDAADAWDREAWTMAPPATAAFWVRRQHQETILHLWDALESQGMDATAAAAVALDDAASADGVDEIVRMFFPRQVRLGRLAPLDDALAVSVAGLDAPLVITGDGSDARGAGRQADAVLSGPASSVLLALWKRLPLDAHDLAITGDPDAARRALSAALTP